jgi:antitoxin component of MazEF toxin-antitoxin module
MAKKTKTKNPIQTAVDTYAAGIVRRAVLEAQTQKNEGVVTETGDALVKHVQATGQDEVAFQAKNGRTLVVQPAAGFWGRAIRTIEPGTLELPEQPKPATAEIADQVAGLLRDGKTEEAQHFIRKAMLNEQATQVAPGDQIDSNPMSGIEARVHAHLSKGEQIAWTYGLRPRFSVRHGYNTEVPIQQLTYKSATMGPIRLSKRAKDLLLENRDAVQRAIGRSDYNAQGMLVSKSRGKIAQYVSELEQKVNELTLRQG